VAQREALTSIYLVCFHSEQPESFEGSTGQFLDVEQGISTGEWPYDNGDDPSFYVARKGGPLTWGVCRQEVRNSICKSSVVVFFSFSSLDDGRVLYRLCGVTTVVDKVDVRATHGDPRFAQFRQLFINCLIRPEKGGWRHDETDRPLSQRHRDWLWRISDHRGVQQKQFDDRYENIYRKGRFSDSALSSRGLRLARNYVVFATDPPEAYISPVPPEVAIARRGEHEKWNDETLKRLTVHQAARFHKNGRVYLRTVNSSGRNVHRHIRFVMPTTQVALWRSQLINALKAATAHVPAVHMLRSGKVRCSRKRSGELTRKLPG
jgi:hypothetical protein